MRKTYSFTPQRYRVTDYAAGKRQPYKYLPDRLSLLSNREKKKSKINYTKTSFFPKLTYKTRINSSARRTDESAITGGGGGGDYVNDGQNSA